MPLPNRRVDVATNARIIEWLKTELLRSVSNIFLGIREAADDVIVDALASTICNSYLLAKRLGISFARIDRAIENTIKKNIVADHELEKWYGDLSAFMEYRDVKKRQ